MQPLYLRAGVHIAAVGDDLICLDVGAGGYACLLGPGRAVPPPGPGGRLDVAHVDVAELLLEAGLVTHEPADDARAALPAPASASCWRGGNAVVTAKDRRRFAYAYLIAAPRFWRAPFGALVANAQCRPSAGLDVATPPVIRDAQVFDQLAPFAPFQGDCLFRAKGAS